MSTATLPAATAPTSSYRVTPARVLRSEWTKFATIRSPRWTLLIAVALTVGLGAIVSAVAGNHFSSLTAHDQATFDPIGVSLAGVSFAELAIGVLGALLLTGEYATGMIRSSLTVVPKRLPVLWAKLLVTGLVSFVVMLPATLVAFLIGQSLLNSHHLGVSLGDDQTWRAVFGAALAAALIAVIAQSIGALLRNTAASISAFVGLFFVLPPLASLLPGSVGNDLAEYLPGSAASAVFSTGVRDAHTLAPGAGVAVLIGYAVVLIAAAAVQLRQRDV